MLKKFQTQKQIIGTREAFTSGHSLSLRKSGRTAYTQDMRAPTSHFRPAGTGLALPAAALALWLALTSTAADAQWKWRDKDGRVTVSDRPPPRDVPDKDILARPDPRRLPPPPVASASAPAGARAPAAAASTALEREVQARKRAEELERAAKAKADEERQAQQRAENCRIARGQAAALESGQRVARTNEKGEREVLDDAGRAEEMRRARAVISSDCR